MLARGFILDIEHHLMIDLDLQIIGLVAGGIFTKMISSGMGKHVSCLPSQSVISMLEFSAISEALNVIGIGVVKISVCLTLLRVVERARRRISHFLWSLFVSVAVTHLALAMLFFLHCRPLAALWNPQVHGSCLSTHTTVLAGYVGFAIDVVTDLMCACLPILVIHRLQMTFRTKVALCVLMGLGVFTAGCAVVKAITLKVVFADDYIWGFMKPATWAAGEQFVGIIIASIPALRPLFSSFLETSHYPSQMFTKTRRYFFSSRTSGSDSPDSIQQQRQQQSQGSKPSTKESTDSARKFFTWYRNEDKEVRVKRSSQTANLDEECAMESVREFDRFDDNRGINLLSAWSPPDILDRTSAMFSIPVPFD